MVFKVLLNIFFVLSLSSQLTQAAVAIPSHDGMFTIFQEGFIFYGCTVEDLTSSLVNPLFCGSARKKYDEAQVRRKLYQQLKSAFDNNSQITAMANDLIIKMRDSKKMHMFILPEFRWITMGLENIAANINEKFHCGTSGNLEDRIKDCPQLEQHNGWTLISVTKENAKEVWQGKDGVIWGDRLLSNKNIPLKMNLEEALFSCDSFHEENGNLDFLDFRLPTIEEARNASNADLVDLVSCNKYKGCNGNWYWTTSQYLSAGAWFGNWQYPIENGKFMALVGTFNHQGAVRCVSLPKN